MKIMQSFDYILSSKTTKNGIASYHLKKIKSHKSKYRSMGISTLQSSELLTSYPLHNKQDPFSTLLNSPNFFTLIPNYFTIRTWIVQNYIFFSQAYVGFFILLFECKQTSVRFSVHPKFHYVVTAVLANAPELEAEQDFK